MGIQDFFASLINIIGAYSNIAGLSLFVLCLVTEVLAFGIPYLLEGSLMIAGYSVLSGGYAVYNLITIIVMTLSGRLLGTWITYTVTRKGGRLMEKIRLFLEPGDKKHSIVNKMISKVNLMSYFSVATGRLMGLRYPLTLIMAAQGKLKTLLLGTTLASLIYDVIYVMVGAFVGANTQLEPFQVMIYFTVGLTVVYIIVFLVRYLRQKQLR